MPILGFAQHSQENSSHRWREAGLPFIQTYHSSEHGGSPQHWDIAQDKRGLIYIANSSGVLEYDGASWRQIYPGNGMSIWTVNIDRNNRVWVGGTRDFGYLAPDTIGDLQFISLLSYIPEEIRESAVRWRVLTTSKGVYVRSRKVLFRWFEQSRAMKHLPTDNDLLYSFVADDEYYVSLPTVGLTKMVGDSLHLVPDGERFAQSVVQVLLPFSDEADTVEGAADDQFMSLKKRFLAVSRAELYIFDGDTFQRWQTQADDFLRKNRIMSGALLPDGRYVFGTRYGGLAVIDREGNLQLVLNKSNGLPDNLVYQTFTDSEGGLWAALNKGLVRVELSSPFSRHFLAPALQSGVMDITRHQDDLYVATAEGLLVMETDVSPGAPPEFQSVSNLKMYTSTMASVGKKLLLTAHEGIFEIESKAANRIKQQGRSSPIWLYQSGFDANRVYIGLIRGLGWLEKQAGNWQLMGEFPGIHDAIEGIAEQGPDTLWAITRYGLTIRLSAPGLYQSSLLDSATIKVERFPENTALPQGWNKVFSRDGKILFASDKGLRRFDPRGDVFPLDSSFGGLFANSDWDFEDDFFAVDEQSRVWTARIRDKATEVGVAMPDEKNGYTWYSQPFQRFAEFGGIWGFHIDRKHKGVYWYGGGDGLIRYDETISKDYTTSYPALIRRVIVNSDSIIYGGGYQDPAAEKSFSALDFADNTIRIEFSAPYFDNAPANQYQYLLEGFDKDWSLWTKEKTVDYRQLPEGSYLFRVRARNVYQHPGEEARIPIEILPPWYRTWWSYLLYSLIVFAGFYLMLRYEGNRQKHKHRARLINIERKKLKELDRLKSDFFANISHEFRTPLTLILGPVEQMLAQNASENKKDLTIIRKNAQRLLQLIDQVLDLSKLERDSLRLQASPGDFEAFLKGLIMSFESWAWGKKIDLQLHVSPAISENGSEKDYFDHDKMDKIFSNLLSNAMKFTPEEGKVIVEFGIWNAELGIENSAFDIRHSAFPAGRFAEIKITDNGIGIPADFLPNIFDRFYQVNASSTRVHGGTGIGLALVKELVELHYGIISVTSKEGEGTTFTVHLPLGKDHLKPEEIIEAENAELGIRNSELENWNSENRNQSEPQIPKSAFAIPHSNLPIVLIIEDNDDVRRYIREKLENEYAILEAADGESGIEMAIEHIPDLVVSDVMMPKKDGYEVCQTLKNDQRTSHIPVILLTAKGGEQAKLAGLETGADAYVLKPFRQQELLVRVRKLIELRRKLRERYKTATVIKPAEVEATSMDRNFLEKVVSTIEANMSVEQFNAEALAREMAMSASQLNRKLNALVGKPAGQMLRSMRLQHAADLLVKNGGTIAEICYACGFSDQAIFTRNFKKQFGSSPSKYRKANQR